MSAKPITRRDFLKAGCLTLAATGTAVCGFSLVIPMPKDTETILPEFSFGDSNMPNRILVAYASALGSTVDVAVKIGQTLGNNGTAVDVIPIQENPSLDNYQAVLIGSAVQHSNWLPEALDFVTANQQKLQEMPVAVFCVHISNQGNDATSRQNRLAYLDPVRALLNPVDEAFFAGKFDRSGAALLMPGWLARFVPTLDMRKWEKIRTWAENVKPRLLG